MRDYRLWAGLVAGLIALAGVLSVTAGGTPPLPPPVAVRGPASDHAPPLFTDGLEFVPATVAELVPVTTTVQSQEAMSADTADPPATVPPPDASADSPPDSPDQTVSPASEATDSPDEEDAVSDQSAPASTDSPDVVAPPADDSPDSADSPEPADSPDD